MPDAIAQRAHELGALTLVEASRSSGIPGPELAKALIERRIPHVLVDGIAHIPSDALDGYLGARSDDEGRS